MFNSTLLSKSFLHALGVSAYVFMVGWIMSNGETWFEGSPELLVPVFILTLLVVSATITGMLVLGRPVLMYLEGKKKEAFAFLGATIGWLVLFLVVIAVFLALT